MADRLDKWKELVKLQETEGFTTCSFVEFLQAQKCEKCSRHRELDLGEDYCVYGGKYREMFTIFIHHGWFSQMHYLLPCPKALKKQSKRDKGK